MRALSECRLYGIIDLSYVARSDVARVAEQMVEGGVDLIQLRGKARSIDELVDLAADLHQLTTKSSTPLIVNDHAEIASTSQSKAYTSGRMMIQSKSRDVKQVAKLWSENPRTALSRHSRRNARARTTLASGRSSPRPRNLIIGRSAFRTSAGFMQK